MSELLTSLDVVNQSFKKSLRGYDAAEVDEFLDHVAETLQSYNQKNKELERELALKQDSLAEYERMKDVLHEALLMAQKSAEADRLRTGVEQIRSIRDMYAQEFRGMLAKFDTQLSQALASSQLSGAVDSVLEGIEKVPAEDEAEEPQAEPERKTDRKDFEAACGILGVDPRELMNSD